MPSFHCKDCRTTVHAASPVEKCPACGGKVSPLRGPLAPKLGRSKGGRRAPASASPEPPTPVYGYPRLHEGGP